MGGILSLRTSPGMEATYPYAIKNQQKAQNAPHVEGFLHALSWFFMA